MKLLLIIAALTLSIGTVSAQGNSNGKGNGKGKPVKVLICHYDEETVVDADGVETVVLETAILSIPEKAAANHIQSHGDVPLQTGDAEADAQALADCQELLDDDDEDQEEDEEESEPEIISLEEANSAEFVNTRTGANNSGSQGAQNAANPVNIADTLHPNIHQNNGTGNAACPQTANNADQCGNRHGIANNPGQSGNHPNDDGTNGFANQLNNVHGGLGAVNPQVDD